MCIIAFKEKGEKPITKTLCHRMWKNNWDGAGYAIWNEDTELWDVKKGFMSFNKFWKTFREEKVTKDSRYILHFRIGTSGNETPELCHPFPIVNDLTLMGELEYSTANLVFHNGVIGKGEEDDKKFEWSDTCVAVRDYIYPLHPYLEDDNVFNFMVYPLKSVNNRWVITNGYQIYQYGQWEIEDGIEYSNDTYKNDRYSATTSVGNYGWGAPYASANEFTTADGKFDWVKWEARKGDQSSLPWTDANVIPPNENENESDVVIVGIDADGNGHPEEEYSEDRASEFLCCPNCFHDKYLDSSPFSVGDTICLICGCVFVDMTGDVVTFDRDLQKKWQGKVKEANNG